MSTSIDTAFIKQFGAEVHEGYARRGSMLRGLVRTKNGVQGNQYQFHIMGSHLNAVQKTRHGVVQSANASHGTATVTLADWYVAENVDKLDELKINHDERGVLTRKMTQALGRKTDNILITVLAAATQKSTSIIPATGGMTLTKAMGIVEYFGANDILPYEKVYVALPWAQWMELHTLEEFTRDNYVGETPLKDFTASQRTWMGVTWFPHSGLAASGGDSALGLAWAESAVGHAIGAEISLDAWWDGNSQSTRLTASMSQGAVLIDDEGVAPITFT